MARSTAELIAFVLVFIAVGGAAHHPGGALLGAGDGGGAAPADLAVPDEGGGRAAAHPGDGAQAHAARPRGAGAEHRESRGGAVRAGPPLGRGARGAVIG